MLKRGYIIFSFAFLLVVSYLNGVGQAVSLRQKMATVSAYNTSHNPEKIFIHTDKWSYTKEDTLWFKAYVFDADLKATSKSGLLYIEIADAANRVINRNLVKLAYGIGWGNITLSSARYLEGTYTIRAYTNWMRNFSETSIYTRQFTIDGTLEEDWMINSRFELTEKEGLSNVKTNLAFVKTSGSRMFGEELRVRINAGARTLYNTRLKTGVDGVLDFDFDLRDKIKTQQLNIALTKKTKGDKDVTFNVPVVINRDEKTDLQFMPEGGSLVNGLPSRVGFKAINEEGKGVDVNGGVYDNTGQRVVAFTSIHRGMGWFDFTPQLNRTYTAKITYHDKDLSFALPTAKPSGVVMRVDNTTNKDSIVVSVNISADIKQTGGNYYLIGQSRNVICFGAVVKAANNARFSINNTAFPTGVARFTVISALNQPVTERIIYVNHNDGMHVEVNPSKQGYTPRDSVNLEIVATDKNGAPVVGSFSVVVTDDAQVRQDTSGYNDMFSKLLLADDLKGEVENPGWYFTKGDSLKKAQSLDVLMLTQGWVSYNWADVFSAKQKPLIYQPEPEFAVKGRVVNAFNKPIEKSNVLLLSLNPFFTLDTMTNAKGEFSFKGIYPPDTVAFSLQAHNKRGRMFNVGIEMDDFTAPEFSPLKQRLIPLYVNIDTSRLKAINTRQRYAEEEAKITGRQLNQVEIRAKKIVKDSKSLVDPGEADFIMNTEEIKALPNTTLVDMLKKNIPGFQVRYNGPNEVYSINNVGAVFILDGIKADIFMGPGFGTKQLLEYMDVNDVKGIEVMTTGRNQIPYTQAFERPDAKFWEFTFIEITTYSGHGFTKKVPGAFIYRLPIFAAQKQFYSPRYTYKSPVTIPDTRSTILWAPNVVTDSHGKGYVTFYTADKSATYTINVQGADMEGLLGCYNDKIYVKDVPKK
ncbi:Plug and carboxypeptidase regulatory-like domain-containing protein [Mucilaginibacter auburnensis]|uniref:MG2 domain-containing protein n=1 Tax=Mucilaginibacter auburnensis TaxID=1457233 RepID=A0A2H9VUQ4_9SPHI|nr:Plug and carboxypeptidase regulatory-like domain-containing protein [Mucilaginibacter auburnensis]PJJ84554.1 hypothetical protein CLV57_1567 [Mucilaginibacter auburnensis]